MDRLNDKVRQESLWTWMVADYIVISWQKQGAGGGNLESWRGEKSRLAEIRLDTCL